MATIALIVGCSNTVHGVSSDTATGTGASGVTGATSSGAGEAGVDSGGDPCASTIPTAWTDCTSPDGFEVCGGTHMCGANCDVGGCAGCWPWSQGVAPCLNRAWSGLDTTSFLCPDGNVLVTLGPPAPDLWECVPLNVGTLYAENGGTGADRLRYADYGLWAGGPLPTPTTCPTFNGFAICGGNCGGCATNQTCTGRSHLHPYGICLDNAVTPCTTAGSEPPAACGSGETCFIFLVEAEAQAQADQNGYCVASDTCQEIAANYPGGAKCVQP